MGFTFSQLFLGPQNDLALHLKMHFAKKIIGTGQNKCTSTPTISTGSCLSSYFIAWLSAACHVLLSQFEEDMIHYLQQVSACLVCKWNCDWRQDTNKCSVTLLAHLKYWWILVWTFLYNGKEHVFKHGFTINNTKLVSK